jgi:hypothetical protein
MQHDPFTDTPRPWQARWRIRADSPADGPAGGIGSYHDQKAPWFWLADETRYTLALMCCAVMVGYGLLLRTAMIPSPTLAAGCLAAVAAAPAVWSAIRRVADRPGRDDGWAGQEHAHWQALPVQLRCSLALDAIGDYLATAPRGWWRSVHLAFPLTAPGQPEVSVYPHGNRLLIVVHRDLLEQGMDPARAVTWVARNLAVMRGWRWQLRLATRPAVRLGSLLIVSWAVPWLWLPLALAAVQATMTAGGWLAELAADRHILTHHGPTGLLGHLPPPASPAPPAGSSSVRWRGRARTVITAAAGFLPPPARLRRALAAARQPQDVTYGHA